MTVAFPVVLDACALVPMPTVDLLLRLGAAKQFRPLWSAEILEETERTLVSKLNQRPEKARARIDAMTDHFPDALVTDYESLTPSMTNHPKDRHVLAAAVRSGAEVIVTFNRRDFPVTSIAPFDIDVRTPDDFLLDQLDLDPDLAIDTVQSILSDMRNPRMTLRSYLDGLAKIGMPLFAGRLDQEILKRNS